MPLGNIVQESHKMQIVYLESTYIDLFLFYLGRGKGSTSLHICATDSWS